METSFNAPEDRLYSDYHVWIKLEDNFLRLGLTELARSELGGVSYIHLPNPGSKIVRDEFFGIVETSKAAVDLIAPLSGGVLSVNCLLQDTPEMILDDPYVEGWLITVTLEGPGQLDQLLDSRTYRDLLTLDG